MARAKKKNPDHHVLLEVDLSGAEWVVVAYESCDAQMISVCEGTESPHIITGHLISKAPKELIAKEDKICGHATDQNELLELREKHLPQLLKGGWFVPRNMTIRQCGKKSNHGLNYMMKPPRFAEEAGLDLEDAKRVHHLYLHQAYPGVPRWWDSIRAELKDGRTLTNCFGRRARLLDEWTDELIKKAVSFKPQSVVADTVRQGMRLAYNDMSKPFELMDLQTNVYDSLMFRYPTDWENLALFAHKLMRTYMNPTLIGAHGREYHIRTEMKMGLHWGADYKPGGMREVHVDADVKKTIKNLEECWEHLNVQGKAA